jgi:hypothetical protein
MAERTSATGDQETSVCKHLFHFSIQAILGIDGIPHIASKRFDPR